MNNETSEQLPRISYDVMIADTSERMTFEADDVTVMYASVLLNKAGAELTFKDELKMDVNVDGATDELTIKMYWKKSGKLYVTIVANKLPEQGDTVH